MQGNQIPHRLHPMDHKWGLRVRCYTSPMSSLNYDPIAHTYHERYRVRLLKGVAGRLRSLAERAQAQRVLEVGCGTGRWLVELQPLVPQVVGLDLSLSMLRKAQELGENCWLACGQAGELPFPAHSFDLVFCVNALHHFPDPARFICDASRVLRIGGILAVIGMDPHRGRDRWYLYQYFEGTYKTDLRRFPSGGQILDWMGSAGFRKAQWGIAEHIIHPMTGEAVLADPFLQKNGTSQLVLLTNQAYDLGIERIRSDLREAAAHGETIIFPVDIELTFIAGTIEPATQG